MQAFVVVVKLAIPILLALAGNTALACTIWQDEEGMWNQEGCTLAELTEQIGPEIDNIAVNEAQGLCDYSITQQSVSASRPYIINSPGIHCVLEDIEIWANSRKISSGLANYPYKLLPVFEIQSSSTSLWFLRHELRNKNVTTDLSDRGYAIGISHSAEDVSISHGRIRGFTRGIVDEIHHAGWLSRLSVYDMEFYSNLYGIGIILFGIKDSSIRQNQFEGCEVGIQSTLIKDSVVEGNIIHISTASLQIPELIGVDFHHLQRVAINNNHIMGDQLLTDVGLSDYRGIDIAEAYDANIEQNTVTGMKHGVVLNTPQHSPWYPSPPITELSNVIQSNEIYGGAGSRFVPGYGYKLPASSDGVAGMMVQGQRALVLKGNRIYSGRDKGYPTGIQVDNTSFVGSSSGVPAFSDNETCGTLYPVSDSALQAQVEGQNQFEVCR